MMKDTMTNDLLRELIARFTNGDGHHRRSATRLLRVASEDRQRGSVALAPATLATAGFVGGLAAGVLLASQQLHRHRRNLFSPRPYERLAALAYLRGQPSVETLRLLHDYLGWEPRPLLRRRGFRVLRELERTLD